MAYSIALVDDDRNILTSVTMVLEAEGFSVRTYRDGAEALRGMTVEPPDMAVLDIKMPRMDGVQATQAIRALAPPVGLVPIVALTANADPEDARRYLSIGMAAVVEKPIKPERLRMAMNAAMSAGQSGSQADRQAQTGRAFG